MGKFQIDTLIQEKTKTCFVDFKKEHSLKENILNCVACMEYEFKLEFLNGYDYIRIEKDMKNKRYSKITLWKRKMAAMEAPLVMHLEEQEKATLELSLITDQNIIGEDGNAAIYVLAA